MEQLVREDLSNVIDFVQGQREQFEKLMMEATLQEQQLDNIRKKRELMDMGARIKELDLLVSRAYEDNVKGKLTDCRFAKMSAQYEAEQQRLVASVASIEKEMAENAKRNTNIDHFVEVVKRNADFTELTSALLNEMIEKIVVHSSDKNGGKRTQQVDIYYNFGIGKVSLDDEAGEVMLIENEHEKAV